MSESIENKKMWHWKTFETLSISINVNVSNEGHKPIYYLVIFRQWSFLAKKSSALKELATLQRSSKLKLFIMAESNLCAVLKCKDDLRLVSI